MQPLLIALTTAMMLGLSPEGVAAQGPRRLERLGWLAGCWERSSGRGVVEEQWMRPRAGLMLGAGRTVEGDSVVEFEQVRLHERGGRLVYATAPSGQPPAEFESALVSDSTATFENPAHDFPQRIIYRRLGTDSLVARIEGVRGGRLRDVDFTYRRAACA
jgi:hypothetical protein